MKNRIIPELARKHKIKILKVVTNFTSGGTEGQVHSLTKALDSQRFDLQFACLKKYGPFLEELEQWQIDVQEFPIRTFYHPATYHQMFKLARFMKAKRVEVCHSYNFYSNLVAVPAARLARVPVVLASIRDRGVYLTPMQKRVQILTCGLADRILVNADAIRDWLIDQGVPERKISTTKNGIDMSLYEKHSGMTDIRHELGIPSTARLVIMLARLNPQKGIDDFLSAASRVHDKHPDVHFLVVGEKLDFKNGRIFRDYNYFHYLEKLAEKMGISDYTWFTGHRTDVASLLSQSSLSVLPSHSEGLSNSLIESMAAGLPLVATDVGGNPELVKHGINGLLVPVQDVEALAAAICQMLADPQKSVRFGEASKRFCREQFSMTRMAAATGQIYIDELHKRD